MPLILICGVPSSGKTTRALEIKEFFEKQKRTVFLINEELLQLKKEEAYKDYNQEKITRAFLKSNVEKHLNQQDIVILDSLNYIKGYRYEIFCLARTMKTNHCVIWCNTNLKACQEYYQNQYDKLNLEQFNDYYKRMEEPKLNQRWDTPLLELRYLEETPLMKIEDIIINQNKKSKDPISTQLEPNLNSNFLFELDNQVQIVNDKILQTQNENIVNKITIGTKIIHLQKNINIIELRKFKLEFLKICKQNPPSSIDQIQDSYASFLQIAMQRI